MRRLLLTIVVSFLLTIIAFSQDENTLAYGDIVTGEITDREFELEYSFEGSEGDIVVILMTAVDILGDLTSPSILLLNEDFDVIADTSRHFNIKSARLVTQLQSDGLYTIITTRNDGRAGTSVGEFNLALIKPQELVYDEVVTASTSNTDSTYYLVQPTQGSLISYQLMSGDYRPQITINTLNDANTDIEESIKLNGDRLTTSIIGILDEGQPYIVLVSKPDFGFYMDDVTADYTLSLLPASTDN